MAQLAELTRRVLEGNLLLSISEASKRLKITRVTIYKWISMGLLQTQGHQAIGGRHIYWFEPDYIDKVANILPKARHRGFSLLNPKMEEKLKQLHGRPS